ncbi:nuclease Le1 [Panus rudis PR-1116 ss-1]|nr:nuclease Le1 [Panus rudis PR-1116 ss-1]
MKPSFIALALGAKSVAAWGALGHQSIGFIAQQFLAPNALSFVQKTLGSQYNFSLGPAATWADEVRSQPAFAWSAPLHFVDAEDDPPTSCSVEEKRDCGSNNCVLGAIANYTVRVVESSLGAEQVQEALKFLDHFIGDIGQPLHVEAIEAGGNGISAICSGSKTNLHSAWDTGILTKHVSQSHGGTAQTYAADLVQEIKTGSFKSLASSWLACSSTTEPVQTQTKREVKLEEDIWSFLTVSTTKMNANDLAKRDMITPLECPLIWASESNAFDCSTVFTFEPGQDLCTGSYFNAAVPVIDLQIAKQGFRLAAWLNVLFDGSTHLP